ncbi:MAG: hypothetical protein GF418_08665 [Chitinivibrionales bacterium]|nr:hypothetical protein [Chitinivibrionales bacterium]
MELVRVIWIFIFFFFALILLFTWSKMAVISGKIKTIMRLVSEAENLSAGEAGPPEGDEGEAKGRAQG